MGAHMRIAIVHFDLLLLHRQSHALLGASIFSAAIACSLLIIERISHGVFRGVADPRIAVIGSCLALAQDYHKLYTTWGVTICHATLYGLPLTTFVRTKTLSALALIVPPCCIAAGVAIAAGRVSSAELPGLLPYPLFMSTILLIIWNFWYHWPPFTHRQVVPLFAGTFILLIAAALMYSWVVAISPSLGVLLAALSVFEVARRSGSAWPRRLHVVRRGCLEASR